VAVNQDGCSSQASTNIIVAPAIQVDATSPFVYDNYNVSVVGGNDGEIDLSITGEGIPTGISWSGPNGFTSNQEDLFNLFAGFYTVTVSDEFGCEIQDTITLVEPGEIKLPNGFTPNGDGFNDFYVIKGIQGYPENQINIFNRWGNLVFSVKGYTNNWDGISNDGNVLPDGTYFIVVDLNKEGKDDIQGFIDLRRK
jgi:gliding motility-associated-like protein